MATGSFFFRCRRLPARLEIGGQRHHLHLADAGPQHAQIIRSALREIDNTVLLPPAHAVIDADDRALSVFRTTHRQPGTQRKMVAGSGKFLLVETLAGGRAPAMKLAAIKTGQTFAYSLHTLRQGDVCRCWGSQQQRRCQPADQHPEPGLIRRGFSEPVSALRHPDGPESDRGDTPSRPVPAIPPSPARHPPLRPPAPGRYRS